MFRGGISSGGFGDPPYVGQHSVPALHPAWSVSLPFKGKAGVGMGFDGAQGAETHPHPVLTPEGKGEKLRG